MRNKINNNCHKLCYKWLNIGLRGARFPRDIYQRSDLVMWSELFDIDSPATWF
jgi:hypothetical protein